MSALRIRIELNKGRVGMPFGKLARVCDETTRFLVMLSEDLGLPQTDAWLAEEFENASVDFDVRYAYPVDPFQAEIGRQALEMIAGENSDYFGVSVRIRPETRRQFRNVTRALDPGEKMRIGVYKDNEHRPVTWFDVQRSDATEITEGIVDRHTYGEVQGVVNAFFKEHDPPYLRIRELSTGALVKCFFRPEMYKAAVELLEDKEAIVFVEGWLREDATTGITREIKVEDFTPACDFNEAEVSALFGSVPDYTGNLTSEQFVEGIRGD
ncbi:hypothetical protein M2650_02550 [Luteimonas sp. SX5]|uniref:Uncharacterized protein n=1 Tax=Luteimonas galliterrae TaxID=2940486 RepID=A0ABT0MF74_9GAMM|nr:hypothetical protein [Luteimonas galliterrae]MCL1633527.1 hypothetical protein [Luteimonas galliterrae]